MSGEQNSHRHCVSATSEFLADLIEYLSRTKGNQAWYIFEEKGLGLELFKKPRVMLEEHVSPIAQESFRRIDRETLARRTTDQDVKHTASQSQLLANLGRINLLYWPGVRECARVVVRERINGLLHCVISIQAVEPGLPEAFSDSACPAEKVNCCELAARSPELGLAHARAL